jgi:hypothetical protein
MNRIKRNLMSKQYQILNDLDIRHAVLEKAKILSLSIPIGIGKNFEYIYDDEVNNLLNKYDEIIIHRMKNILGEYFKMKRILKINER